jgi:hypothetical protein
MGEGGGVVRQASITKIVKFKGVVREELLTTIVKFKGRWRQAG